MKRKRTYINVEGKFDSEPPKTLTIPVKTVKPKTILLEATAYHEAGHAVVAWRIGMKFRRVTIEPDGGSLGHMLHAKHPKWFNPEVEFSDRIRLRCESHIIVSYAGQLAQARFRGRRPRWGMESDNHWANEMASRLMSQQMIRGSNETFVAFQKFCWQRSLDTVNERWLEIGELATALLERKTLSYDEALKVILGAREKLCGRKPLPRKVDRPQQRENHRVELT